jgi:DNA polymerase III subunit alpha
MSFIHLRTHSDFSIVDGTLQIDAAVKAAAADGQGALAITDMSNLFAAVRFYTAARGRGVKPLIGCDVWVSPEVQGTAVASLHNAPASSRLLLLVQTWQGYLNLCALLSRAWQTNQRKGHGELHWAWLSEPGANGIGQLSDGLIALSGAEQGEIGLAFTAGDAARAALAAKKAALLFAQRFYIELQRYGVASNEPYIAQAVALAAQLKLPVVATHPVQFLKAEDFETHEARVCIAEGEILANPRRIKRFTADQYFKTQAQMEAAFADIPSAILNTVQIAQRCNLTLTLGKPRLPDFPTPDGSPIEEYFRKLSHEGLEQRLAALYKNEAKRDAQRPRYVERLEFEINTIIAMGFPGYFLIVADFINWALNNGCPVGPGRGSGAGSLVAYSLGITGLDPLAYNLIFERFLNPERVSMPDFDIDFCVNNRDRVIDYVKDKYGHDAVSQIATFGTMAARAAVRDVGRVLDFPYGFVDGIAKLIATKPGKVTTLIDPAPGEKKDDNVIYARDAEPMLAQREKAEEDVAEVLRFAAKLEGTPRNVGMHAGGVLIAPGKLTDFTPLYVQPGETAAVSQYDKDDVEAIGLVKFDFLGLATLTILEHAKQSIRARYPERKEFNYEDLPLDDPKVYALFQKAEVEAVFQFESRGMRGMLKQAKPERLEDLIALNALYRPGPMDLIPSYCARKAGTEKVEYPHPSVEAILKETYGIMVYQEQVMQMAQIVGGYTLGGADLLRRAMGKKKPEEMAKHRVTFAEGAAHKGVNELKANEIFDLMEKFAGYGFNKSHSAAYALLAYHTAWLKVYFPAEFFCANMTVEMDDTDKLKLLVDDAKAMGLYFEPPNVNTGGYAFEPVNRGLIRYGLGAIKGTGQGAINAILQERKAHGAYKSLFDFCNRIDLTRVNKRVVEALVKAGAFDTLGHDRATLLATVERAMSHANSAAAAVGQGGLFDSSDTLEEVSPEMSTAPAWSLRETLSFEKQAIGFYLSGHLFDEVAEEMLRLTSKRIGTLADSKELVLVAGVVTSVRFQKGMRGAMAILMLDDKSGAIEAVAYSELLDAKRHLFKEDELLVVRGKVQFDRFNNGLRLGIEDCYGLNEARKRFGKSITLSLNGQSNADTLSQLITKHNAADGLPLKLMLKRNGVAYELELGAASKISPTEDALSSLRKLAVDEKAVVQF